MGYPECRCCLIALNAAQEMVAEIDHISLSANTPYGLEPLALGVGIEQGAALIGSLDLHIDARTPCSVTR